MVRQSIDASMGSFGEHDEAAKSAGLGAFCIGTLAILWMGFDLAGGLKVGIFSAAAAYLGAHVPDLDSNASIPRQTAGKASSMGVLILGIGTMLFAPGFTESIGALAGSIIGITASAQSIGNGLVILAMIGAYAEGGDMFNQLFTHRGLFHSPLMAFGLGVLGYFVLTTQLGWMPIEASVAALGLTAGVFVHLSVDGVVGT